MIIYQYLVIPSWLFPFQEEQFHKEQFIESGIFEEMTSTQGTQTQAEEPPKTPPPLEVTSSALATSTPSSLSKISEYGSCEELEMINGPGR